jgi:tetratricopeptide (TPR) repeat protein
VATDKFEPSEFDEFISAKRFNDAIAYVDRLLRLQPDDRELRRYAAVARGCKGEHELETYERMQVWPPPERVDALVALYTNATEIDPDLPDSWSGLAVIHARFLGEPAVARTHLARAEALAHRHPRAGQFYAMLGVVRGMIRTAERGAAETAAEDPLASLVAALFLDLQGPTGPPHEGSDETPVRLVGDVALDHWAGAALQLVEAGDVRAAALPDLVERAASLQGPNGDRVMELLALVARTLGDDASVRTAVETRVEGLLRQFKMEAGRARHQQRATPELSWLGRTAAEALEGAGVAVDPVLHAEALLAWGGTFTFENDRRLDEALPLYVRALELFLQAPAPQQVAHLEQLITTMIKEQLAASRKAAWLGGRDLGPVGLEAALDAAVAIDSNDLVVTVARVLAKIYGALARPHRAEAVLRDLLATAELGQEQQLALRSELAGAISEQHRFREALQLQSDVVNARRQRGGVVSGELLQLANFMRETGDLPGAIAVLEEALVGTERSDGAVSSVRVRAQALLGQARVLHGDRSGLDLLDEAVEAARLLPDVDLLHLHRLVIDTARGVGDHDRARRALQSARSIQRLHLRKAPDIDVWQGLLQRWAPLDFAEVHLSLADGGDGPVAAVLAAEAAKGRILQWAVGGYTAEAAEHAIADQRAKEDFELVQNWLDARSRRSRVISLFAASDGLAVVTLRPHQLATGRWLAGISYPELAADVFDPWTELLDAAAAGDHAAWQAASIATDAMLRWIGELLWRATPDLTDGGEELVILPHRILRVLPLWAAVLPGGARLGELFDQVTVLPSLDEMARRVQRAPSPTSTPHVLAFADPDGSLPFARLEALALAGPSATLGADVTTAMVREALSRPSPAIMHLACHGSFNTNNPLNSAIHTADGDLLVHELLDSEGEAPIVVLGACEAGRTHRGPSDEPFGFPALLLRRGAATVVAPSWQVDDLASLLLLTQMHGRRPDQPIAAAMTAAAAWLRDLTAGDAATRLEQLRDDPDVATSLDTSEHTTQTLRNRLDASLSWLRELPARARPFRSPLDWAAFQVSGLPDDARTKERP